MRIGANRMFIISACGGAHGGCGESAGLSILAARADSAPEPHIVPLQAHGDKSPAVWNAPGATTFITYGNFDYTAPPPGPKRLSASWRSPKELLVR